MPNRLTRNKAKRAKIYEIPGYAQSEEFTGSAACAMMVLKYINPNFKMKKDVEFEIWNDAIGGSIWHGSKYGIAYALAKRGAKPRIISSNVKDEGYERKLAVYEGTNLDTLRASYNEIREKVKSYKITEEHKSITINTVKKELDDGRIPIVLVNANGIDSNTDAGPQWVVVKGYDDDTFYINDPYSDNTVAMEPHVFKSVLGYDNECHIISVSSRRSGDIKSR
ncbi:MAG: peptidase C39 family protein [Candidatus Marsarchaeota archaeon]|jgi:Domain of unknown function (DUF3335).|nr:peptidase C39 family protein [Candidatus Marsarchaeota archaeon]